MLETAVVLYTPVPSWTPSCGAITIWIRSLKPLSQRLRGLNPSLTEWDHQCSSSSCLIVHDTWRHQTLIETCERSRNESHPPDVLFQPVVSAEDSRPSRRCSSLWLVFMWVKPVWTTCQINTFDSHNKWCFWSLWWSAPGEVRRESTNIDTIDWAVIQVNTLVFNVKQWNTGGWCTFKLWKQDDIFLVCWQVSSHTCSRCGECHSPGFFSQNVKRGRFLLLHMWHCLFRTFAGRRAI